MTTIIPKDQTVAALRGIWSSLGELLGELSDDEWSAASPLPGWTVQDTVSHIIGTEAMLLGKSSPDEIDRDANPHVKNDIGAFNEAWVESLRSLSPSEMLSRFREVKKTSLSEEQFRTEILFKAQDLPGNGGLGEM